MSDRDARAAARAILHTTRQAISCVTEALLLQVPSNRPRTWALRFTTNRATLRAKPPLLLAVNHEYELDLNSRTGNWTPQPRRYRYELLDDEDNEILAFHWHPGGLSPIATPHLHVDSRHPRFDLAKAHIPTGIVSLPAVLRCLITEFGVEPLRPDWDQILRES